MKKGIFSCICVWVVLILSILVVYAFARDVKPVMQTPEITNVYVEDNSVVFTWNPVEYATSYSIHRKTDAISAWELLNVVGSGSCSYTDQDAAALDYQYSVRACNVSLGEYHWSMFSATVTVP